MAYRGQRSPVNGCEVLIQLFYEVRNLVGVTVTDYC